MYRYLARLKWEAYDRKVGVQRIQQMQVIPDVLSAFEPVVDVRLHFRLKSVRPGQFINSRTSQEPATVSIQTFDREPKKITIAMVDPDIPDTGSDSFKENCHFLAANISVGPTSPSIDLAGLSANEHVILPWLPPFAQKGSPYHRLAILVLQQKEGNDVDVESMRQKVRRDGFKTRGFMGTYRLSPVGATMFRCIWDEGTEEVMKRAGIEGYDVEYRRRPIEPLPYRKRDSERFR